MPVRVEKYYPNPDNALIESQRSERFIRELTRSICRLLINHKLSPTDLCANLSEVKSRAANVGFRLEPTDSDWQLRDLAQNEGLLQNRPIIFYGCWDKYSITVPVGYLLVSYEGEDELV